VLNSIQGLCWQTSHFMHLSLNLDGLEAYSGSVSIIVF